MNLLCPPHLWLGEALPLLCPSHLWLGEDLAVYCCRRNHEQMVCSDRYAQPQPLSSNLIGGRLGR